MAYLLDTCAVSELKSELPNPKVVETLLAIPRDEIFFSVINIGEIKQGIEAVKSPSKKTEYEQWLEKSILAVFSDSIIPIDLEIALHWGSLLTMLESAGKRMQVKDSLIAATAFVHGLTVVTRDEDDFAPSGVRILNPWKSADRK